MFELFKFLVFFASILLLTFMVRLATITRKRWEFRTSTFMILIGGTGVLTLATFLDIIETIYNNSISKGFINICFTLGAITYIIGVILWSNYTMNMIIKYEEISLKDSMTGVFNRNGIEKVYKSLLKDENSFYILVCDLDGTKRVNDKKGHLQGDQYIIKTIDIIKKNIAENGYVSRIGGDEFVVILEFLPKEELEEIIINIKNAVSMLYPDFSSGISIGYVRYPQEGIILSDLIKAADSKMYKDKTRKPFN